MNRAEVDLEMAVGVGSASGGEMCRMMLFEILTLWHVVCQKVWRRELVRLQRMAPKLAMLLGGYELLMGPKDKQPRKVWDNPEAQARLAVATDSADEDL
jgi:hypothetical protein